MTGVTPAAVGPRQHESQIRVALMGNLADEMRGGEQERSGLLSTVTVTGTRK